MPPVTRLVQAGLCLLLAANAFAAAPKADPKAAEAEAAAEKVYRDIFGEEHDKAAKGAAAGKVAFAKKLAENLAAAADNPAQVAVMRRHAIEFASADAAGYPLAHELLKAELAGGANLKNLEKSADLLEKWLKAEKPAGRAAVAENLHATYVQLAAAQAADAQFDAALKTLDKAKVSVRQNLKANKDQFADLTARGDAITQQKATHAALESARATLAAKPADPAANTTLGLHLLLTDGKPKEAAPHLAKSGDAAIKKLGELLAAPAASDLDLADAFRAAASASAADKTELQLHARTRYEAVLAADPAHAQATRIKLLLGQLPKGTPVAGQLPPASEPLTRPDPTMPAATGPREIRRMKGHNGDVWEIAVSPDGKRALSGGSDGVIILWDLDAGAEIRRLTGHSGTVNGVAFTPDGKRAVSTSGQDRTVRLWDLAAGREIKQLGIHAREGCAIIVTKDGRFAVSGGFDSVRLWDIAAGKQLREFGRSAYAVTLSPDGRLGASAGDDKALVIFEPSTLRIVKELKTQSHAYGLAFNRDAGVLYSGGPDKTIRAWDVKTGNELRQFSGHGSDVGRIALTADGRRLVSASHDHTVRVWDTATGKELHCFDDGGVRAPLAVLPDGRHALAGCDRGIRLLQLP